MSSYSLPTFLAVSVDAFLVGVLFGKVCPGVVFRPPQMDYYVTVSAWLGTARTFIFIPRLGLLFLGTDQCSADAFSLHPLVYPVTSLNVPKVSACSGQAL